MGNALFVDTNTSIALGMTLVGKNAFDLGFVAFGAGSSDLFRRGWIAGELGIAALGRGRR